MVFIPFKGSKEFESKEAYMDQFNVFLMAQGHTPEAIKKWFSQVCGVTTVRIGDQVLPASVYKEGKEKHGIAHGQKIPHEKLPLKFRRLHRL